MKKRKQSPTILKPVIDEEAALRFAMAGSGTSPEPSIPKSPEAVLRPAAKKAPDTEVEKNVRLISFAIKKDLYDKIAEEAARKNRTIEEHLRKHLMKRYGK